MLQSKNKFLKVFRKFALIAIIPILTLSALSARFIFLSKNALAAADYNALSYVVAGGLNVDATGIKSGGWQNEYDLGDVITPDIPAGTKLLLKYPDGGILADSAAPGKIRLDAPGYYTAVYTKNDKPVTREFKFNVIAENYRIELPFNGADIPTLIGKGETFALPKASVVYTDKIDEIQTLNNPDIYVTVAAADSAPVTFMYNDAAPIKEITASQNTGKIFVTYSFGHHMKSVVQKDYIITITDSINDKLSPTLNVASVPQNVSLMTKLTLPIAYATDQQDNNLKIEIIVKAPDGAGSVYTVKENMLDQYMIDNNAAPAFIADKYKDENSADYYAGNTVGNPNRVTLDNKRDMTFYPNKAGLYEITYKATNDAGKTAAKTFSVNVEDTEEPYIKVQSKEIPGTWTNTKLIKGKVGSEITITDVNSPEMRLYFPKPAFADNASLEPEMFEKTDNVKIELIKGSTTLEVLTYKNGVYESNKTGTETIIGTDEDRFYIPATKLDSGAEYEIAYLVSDTALPARAAEARFAVKIVSELKDLLAPQIDFKDMAGTVKLGGKFTKPVVNISDNSGTEAKEEIIYALSCRTATDIKANPSIAAGDFDFTDMKNLFYKGAMEKFDIKKINPDAAGANGFGTGAGRYDKIVVFVCAKDGVGNESRQASIIDIIDTSLTDLTAPVFTNIDYPADITAAENAAGRCIDLTYNGPNAGINGEFAYGSDIIIKDIKIEQAGVKDIYIGYEFTIRNGNGEIVGAYTKTTSWIDTSGADTVLYIDEFKVAASDMGAGRYTITLSVFNVSNAVRSINFTLEVAENGIVVIPMSDIKPMASGGMDIPDALEYGRVIEIPDFAAVDSNGDPLADPLYRYKRTIKGPHYSLQGFELLALKIGSYTIIVEAASHDVPRLEKIVMVYDTVGPDIKLTGVVPAVSLGTGKNVYLPNFIASDASGIDNDDWTQAVIVTNGGTHEWGKKITQEIYDELVLEEPGLAAKIKIGMYYFKPFIDNGKADGNYVVTYYAVDNNGQISMIMFVLQIVDWTEPEPEPKPEPQPEPEPQPQPEQPKPEPKGCNKGASAAAIGAFCSLAAFWFVFKKKT